jgi:hypothetical protein
MKTTIYCFILSLLILASCSKHISYRSIILPDSSNVKLTETEVNKLKKNYQLLSRFNRSLSTYTATNDIGALPDSSFVRLDGFVLPKFIIDSIYKNPEVKNIGLFFGVNGFEKKGLRKRPSVNIIVSGLNSTGHQIMMFNTEPAAYDQLARCPPCAKAE